MLSRAPSLVHVRHAAAAVTVAAAVLAPGEPARASETTCLMVEARHVPRLVHTVLEGFGDRDQYGAPMRVNGAWDLPLIRHYPDSDCTWGTTTSTGHRIEFDVLHARREKRPARSREDDRPPPRRAGFAMTRKGVVPLTGTPFPLPSVDPEEDTVRLGGCPPETDRAEEHRTLISAPFSPERLEGGKSGRHRFSGDDGLVLLIARDRTWSTRGRAARRGRVR